MGVGKKKEIETVVELRYKLFAIELLKTAEPGERRKFNQTKAYRSVYGENIDDATANVNGSKLLRNAKVQKYLKEYTDKFFGEKEKEIQKLLDELKSIAYSDIKDYLSWRTEKTKVGEQTLGRGKNKKVVDILDYAPVLEVVPSDKVDGRNVSEVSISPNGIFKFKMYDKVKAADILSKIYELQKEVSKHEITGKDGGSIKLEIYMPEKKKLDEDTN